MDEGVFYLERAFFDLEKHLRLMERGFSHLEGGGFHLIKTVIKGGVFHFEGGVLHWARVVFQLQGCVSDVEEDPKRTERSVFPFQTGVFHLERDT